MHRLLQHENFEQIVGRKYIVFIELWVSQHFQSSKWKFDFTGLNQILEFIFI